MYHFVYSLLKKHARTNGLLGLRKLPVHNLMKSSPKRCNKKYWNSFQPEIWVKPTSPPTSFITQKHQCSESFMHEKKIIIDFCLSWCSFVQFENKLRYSQGGNVLGCWSLNLGKVFTAHQIHYFNLKIDSHISFLSLREKILLPFLTSVNR